MPAGSQGRSAGGGVRVGVYVRRDGRWTMVRHRRASIGADGRFLRKFTYLPRGTHRAHARYIPSGGAVGTRAKPRFFKFTS